MVGRPNRGWDLNVDIFPAIYVPSPVFSLEKHKTRKNLYRRVCGKNTWVEVERLPGHRGS